MIYISLPDLYAHLFGTSLAGCTSAEPASVRADNQI